MTNNKTVTQTSHPNLALIKYWGKLDIDSNIPTNPSISVLLPKLITKTEISYNNESNDILILDDCITKLPLKMINLIKRFKTLAKEDKCITIRSSNNFPHSCGMASSASGYSALVKCLNEFYNTNLCMQELCDFARYGSGSAARSIHGGIVKWDKEGVVYIGEWEDLRAFIIIVSDEVKKVGSTEGMIRTVATSNLYKFRLQEIDKKVRDAMEYIKSKDFENLGQLAMRESNEMHAIFMDTFPPILYMNEKSMNIVEDVIKMNESGFKAFYTFDAGPNPTIFVLNKDYDEVYEYFESKKYKIIVAK